MLVTVVTSRRCQAGPSAPYCPTAERVIGAVGVRVVTLNQVSPNDDRSTQATTAGEPPRVTTPLSPVPGSTPAYYLGPRSVSRTRSTISFRVLHGRLDAARLRAARRGATPVPTLISRLRDRWARLETRTRACGNLVEIRASPGAEGADPRRSESPVRSKIRAGRGDATAPVQAADRPVDPLGRRQWLRSGSSVGGRSSVRPGRGRVLAQWTAEPRSSRPRSTGHDGAVRRERRAGADRRCRPARRSPSRAALSPTAGGLRRRAGRRRHAAAVRASDGGLRHDSLPGGVDGGGRLPGHVAAGSEPRGLRRASPVEPTVTDASGRPTAGVVVAAHADLNRAHCRCGTRRWNNLSTVPAGYHRRPCSPDRRQSFRPMAPGEYSAARQPTAGAKRSGRFTIWDRRSAPARASSARRPSSMARRRTHRVR